MATEVCSASPRISFSHGIPNGSAAGGESQRADGSLPLEQGVGDFDFSIGFPISADLSSNADELFSNGKILPFFKNPGPADNKPHGSQPCMILDRRGSLRELIDYSTGSNDDSASTASEIRGTGRRSFWRFGRSSSVGSVADHGPIFSFSLNRCKSTGSFPNPARRQQQQVAGTMVGNLKQRSNSNQKKTYYFSGSQRGSHGGAIRINPILNVPAPIITTGSGGGGGGGGGSGASSGAIAGIFAYLLCNCGGEGKRDEIGDFLTSSQQNGTAIVNCGR